MITKAKIADADEIFDLHCKTLCEVTSRFYPPEIIEIWQRGRSAAGLIPFIEHDNFYVFKSASSIDGFIHFVDNEICGLYISAEKIGQGIGSQLFTFAVSSMSAWPIKVQSNLNAIDFYTRMGCKALGYAVERRFERDIYILNMEFP